MKLIKNYFWFTLVITKFEAAETGTAYFFYHIKISADGETKRAEGASFCFPKKDKIMKPGDKVICINATIDPDKAEEIRKDFEIWITKDKEYTIREILDNNGIVPGLLLDEVHNLPKYFKLLNRFQEPAFALWRFRKLNYATKTEAVEEEHELVEVGTGTKKQTEKEKGIGQ